MKYRMKHANNFFKIYNNNYLYFPRYSLAHDKKSSSTYESCSKNKGHTLIINLKIYIQKNYVGYLSRNHN